MNSFSGKLEFRSIKQSMNIKHRNRIIQGIVLINLSIFLLSSFFLTERGSYSYETGNQVDHFFSWLSARKGWSECLLMLLCSSIFSLGLYRICIKPLNVNLEESKNPAEKKSKSPYWS